MSYKDRSITFRLPPAEADRLIACVESGIAINISDFVRQAVREKMVREKGALNAE